MRTVYGVRFTRLNVDAYGEFYVPRGMASAPGYIGTVQRRVDEGYHTWYCFEDRAAAGAALGKDNALGGVIEEVQVVLPLWKQPATRG